MITGKTKTHFDRYRPWYWFALSYSTKLMILYRWFNLHTDICIDIQHWQHDGFDYAVQHPVDDIVFVSNKRAGERHRDFDNVLKQAIEKASEIYNYSNV